MNKQYILRAYYTECSGKRTLADFIITNPVIKEDGIWATSQTVWDTESRHFYKSSDIVSLKETYIMYNKIIPLDKPIQIKYTIVKDVFDYVTNHFHKEYMDFTPTATSVCITYRSDGSFFNFQVLDEEGITIRAKYCPQQWYNDIFKRYTGYEKVPSYQI